MMKTDADLLREFVRHFLNSAGGPSANVDLLMKQFDQMFGSQNPPVPMSDDEYAQKLEQMKKEGPAFLQHLLSSNFPKPPPGQDPLSKN